MINRSDHDDEDGLAWKVKTLADKEVKNKRKRNNRTADFLLNGEGKKNKHSMLGIGDGRTLLAKMVNMREQKMVRWYNSLAHTVLR